MNRIVRTEQEINELKGQWLDHMRRLKDECRYTRWEDLIFEHGVGAVLDWLTDSDEPNPLSDK